MAPTKRAAGDEAAPPPGRRLRATVALGPSPSRSDPAPLPSPRKRFRAVALVVLCFKRPKDRSTDDCVPISPLQIGRLVKELGHISYRLGTIARQLQTIMEPTRVPSLDVNDLTRPSPNCHNHKRVEQDTNQEGTSALPEGLAKEHEGKDANIRLRFLSEIKPPVYHDEEIKSIRIGIFDGNTIIKSGPYSELKVELLALEGSFPYDAKGTWTPEEFHEHRAYGRYGEGNVLAGEGIKAQLTNGECYLGSIRFKEGSCRARKRMFIIGARVCGGQAIGGRVQEAVMSPVVVHDRRNKYNQKNYPPNLNDEVYRLENISINGKYHERLTKNNICTVEQFSKALYKDEDNLARILDIKKKCKDWDKMVKHAQQCSLEGKPELKSYRCEAKNVVLFFNYVHRLVGAKFDGHYIASEKFEPAQQYSVDKLKKTAYDQWDVLTEDHIMKDNIPVPIATDADADAGPSCPPSATQQNSSGHRFAVHQVGGNIETEVLSLHAPGLRSSISDPHIRHNYQVGGIPAAEGWGHGLNEPPFEIANNGPSSGFSVPEHPRTQNYQDQGSGLASEELDPLFAQDCTCGVTDVSGMHLFVHGEGAESAFLQPQADTNNWVAPGLHQGDMQSFLGWPGQGNGTLETLVSAHVYMLPGPHQLGAPGSGQGSMQNQIPSLPNDGTRVVGVGSTGSSTSSMVAMPREHVRELVILTIKMVQLTTS